MKQTASLALIGGDLRQAVLAGQFAADGHTVAVCALERHEFPAGVASFARPEQCPAGVQAVILPMPVLRDELHLNAPLANAALPVSRVLDALPPGMLVLGGAVPDPVRRRAERAQLRIIDYLQREELAIRNAVPAALAVLPRPPESQKRPRSFKRGSEAALFCAFQQELFDPTGDGHVPLKMGVQPALTPGLASLYFQLSISK